MITVFFALNRTTLRLRDESVDGEIFDPNSIAPVVLWRLAVPVEALVLVGAGFEVLRSVISPSSDYGWSPTPDADADADANAYEATYAMSITFCRQCRQRGHNRIQML